MSLNANDSSEDDVCHKEQEVSTPPSSSTFITIPFSSIGDDKIKLRKNKIQPPPLRSGLFAILPPPKNEKQNHFTSQVLKNQQSSIRLHEDDLYAKSKMTIEHVNDDSLAEIFMYVPACEKSKIALVCKKWNRVLKNLELTHWEDDDHSTNDDDLSAKDNMIIKRVNNYCLAEIFMFVPACERPKMASVCKKWKKALDASWCKVKKLELTHWEYDEYPHILKKTYPTIDGQFNFLKSLLNKCGRYLTELDLSVYFHCNIVLLINEYCPNLEKLRIRIKYIDDTILDNAFTRLSKLKVLKIIFHYRAEGTCLGVSKYISVTLINSLLNVADTLIELSLSNWDICLVNKAEFPEEMTSVISQLKSLKKFIINGIECKKSLCDYVNNSKTIETICDDGSIIDKIKKENILFKYIEVLNISDWLITDDGVYMIANTLKRLHTFHVSCTWLTDAGIVACTKMNNLKFLDFCGFNNATDSSIKLLKNKEYLRLPYSNKITDKSAIKVLENSPKMNRYSVENTGITHKFIEKAAEISRNRKRQLEILVTLEGDMSNTQVEYEYLTVNYVKKKIQQYKD